MSLPPVEREHITEDHLREWKNGNPSFKLPEPVPMLRFLYELCSTMVRGELPLQKCRAALDSVEFCEKVLEKELASSLADTVTQMSQDLTMPGEHRARLTKLAKWLVESCIVPLRLFQERCEEEFLWEAEMIKIKAQELKSKEVRVNTRLLYQQTKFNLLREESEGYAKLVTLLCENSENSSHNAGATIGIIKSLIGHFDLDPNHVFDIVLECFELLPDNNVFLELIPIFPKSHASQILGFKFQHYQRLEVNDPVPFGLYKLTALLVKENFIDLDSICAHLLPKDDEAFEHYSSFSSKQLDEANKIGKINLAATGKDLMEDEKQGDVTIDLLASLDMDSEAVGERSTEFENNQTLGLLTGFLSVDDWYHAYVLFDRLSPLNPVEHIQICNSLFRLIEKSISSAYDTVRQARLSNLGYSGTSVGVMTTENSSASGSFIELQKELFQMLATVGPYLYRDTLLLQKVCRVLRAYYLSAPEVGRTGEVAGSASNPRFPLKEARSLRQVAMSRVEEAFRTCLLPSLQLVPANPAVGMEIWEVMSLLPYEVRYRLYGEWEKEDERIPMVLAARQTAKLDTRRILKRLAKENLKQQGRMVAKLAHANPMTVLRTIIHQIEAYKDMITPVVDAFKYLTQLEYDILEYVVIERLVQGGRDKLKDDGLNLSDWLQSLASFWGHLCKKYPSMELRGLFQYLVNQLKKGQGIELVVLQELIQQMANVHHTEDLTEDQLDAMAGGETLRHQATGFGVTRHNKQLIKSTNRLRDSLLPEDETKLAIPLLLHLAQHRSLVIIDADAPYIKMVSEQFDRCHGALLQYVDFLCSAMPSASAYAQLIPSLDDLVHKYHLDPEVAFLIYRPVMRLFKSPTSSDVFWPLDNNDAQSITSAHSESEAVQSSGIVILDLGSTWNPITWFDLLDTAKTMLPARAWNSLSPDLYATFWGLTLYDLYVPRNCYESEIGKQQSSLKVLEEQPDNSISAITKRKKEKERIQESIDRLTNELRKHEEHVASVRKRLSREKDKWLSSCLDTLKINMEFLQRCIFPRCTFSMPDAVYCAMFVHTLHSLGTPFFNTVNHMDVLICRTLQPMICCCTESEVGRLGKFLCETLKIAYYWKSDESIYERECGNMPGFAVYYRFPDSQRVRYGQFVKVHWKWSQRITRLLGQCLESTEYMEIRNALIILSRISSVFPVTKKSGMNLERRVSKIKGDGREDLKVLATSVGASLAARKPSLVSDEEFCMGYVELKSTTSSKPLASSSVAIQSGPAVSLSQTEPVGGRAGTLVSQHPELINSARDHVSKTKPAVGKLERAESISTPKSDQGHLKVWHLKVKGASLVNGSDAHASVPSANLQSGTSRPTENQVQGNEISNRMPDENMGKHAAKSTSESELSAQAKRSVPAGAKQLKQDLAKDESKSGKAAGATNASSVAANGSKVPSSGKGSGTLGIEPKLEAGSTKFSNTRIPSSKEEGAEVSDAAKPPSSRFVHSPRHDNSATLSKSSDKLQKRTSPAEETDRQSKRRKGEAELRDVEGEARLSDRERSVDARLLDLDKSGNDDRSIYKATEKTSDRVKDKGSERHESHDKDHRERSDRPDKSRGDDLVERSRDRSMERHGRDHSAEKLQERGTDRNFDRLPEKSKDEKGKGRYTDISADKSHAADDRYHGQSLPPPPPLPPHIVPQSVSSGRRDEDLDRRTATARHTQRLSPRHDEKERRRSEENSSVSQDDSKRRREDDFRERKRDDREGLSVKVEERDREREREREREKEREKANLLKEDPEAISASKRRKLKREHLPSAEAGEYSPVHPPPPLSISLSKSYDGRDRGERKGPIATRSGYVEEPSLRNHGKEVSNKMNRRDTDPFDWDDDKRQRVEQKRRHRKN